MSLFQEFITQNILYWETDEGATSELPVEWPELTWVDLSENRISLLPDSMVRWRAVSVISYTLTGTADKSVI